MAVGSHATTRNTNANVNPNHKLNLSCKPNADCSPKPNIISNGISVSTVNLE